MTTTHTRLTALFPGLPRWAGTRKVKPIWILLKQETVSGSGISWSICKSASRSRQMTMPAPHHSVFYRPDALPAAQPTASKHWRHMWRYFTGCKILRRSPDPDLAPFRECFSSTGWDLQWLTYVPNLKSLHAAVMKIWMVVQNVKIEVVWGG